MAGTHGTADRIAEDFSKTEELVGFFTVNITDIIRRLRTRAHGAGVDLSGPFFFLPDDPRFEQILKQVKRERDARLARLRRDKEKSAIVTQRSRSSAAAHQGISAVHRVAAADAVFA
jgi:hypothetical protein